MKKKIIIGVALIVLGIALAVIFVLRMSSAEEPAAVVKPVPSESAEIPAPTPEPTPTPTPEPDTTPAFVVAKEAPAVLAYLMRGDEVEIVGDYEALEGYFIVKAEPGYGIVEKSLLRLDGEEPYAEWHGYAAGSVDVSSSLDLADAAASLRFNDELTVLDEFDNAYLVEVGGVMGFVPRSSVRNYWVDPNQLPSGGGSESGGGDSGSGADGGDISLASFIVEQEGEASGAAVVRADNTPLILAIFEYDEEVSVISVNGEKTAVWFCGLEAEVETRFLRMDGESAYAVWTGYMKKDGLYDNILLLGDPEVRPAFNTEIEVLNDFDGVYLVRYGEKLFYTNSEFISETYIEVTYNPGGGGGGSESGGGDSGGEWTEPQL